MPEREAGAAAVSPPRRRSRRRTVRILVDRDLCKLCGICVKLCPADVFDTDESGRPMVARLDQCTMCLFCERHCPDFAVEVLEGRAAQASAGSTATGRAVAEAAAEPPVLCGCDEDEP